MVSAKATVVASRNVLKMVLAIMIVEHGMHLLLILIGYRAGGTAPIVEPGIAAESFTASAVDPLPQALVLTSIVIGLGVLALVVALCVRLYDRYGTFDISALRRLKG